MTGRDFKAYRLSLGLSQTALAARLGVSRRQICILEKRDDVGPMTTLAMRALVSVAA